MKIYFWILITIISSTLIMPVNVYAYKYGLGSCLDQDFEQPIWSSIKEENVDGFIFLGDNVYGDQPSGTLSKMKTAYEIQKNKLPSWLMDNEKEIVAIWDDHDYGLNDGGKDYKLKKEAQKMFLNFWNISPSDPRSIREGTYFKKTKNINGTAVEIIGDREGIQLSTKRITLSTSGIVPKILEWGKDVDTRLAISLHAPNDKIRDEIVPINKKYPLKELIQACQDYPRTRNSKRITFEYVMLKGVNDKISDARQLIKLIHGIPAKINLIPFNPWPNSPYECSDRSQIKKFSDILNNAGYSSPIRKTRGQDIMAACGQLKSDSVKTKRSELKSR